MKHLGTVYIVGAGPGSPDLITCRGLACLRQADVVLHDRLIDRRLIGEAMSGAEVINVGKESGLEDIQQQHIQWLMIERARMGKSVCRLKGGDPFVFGRGGEEARALSDAGIPFEIVPGVSSAIAVPAAAGIPVTDRNRAQSFMVIAGSRSHQLESPEWTAARALINAGGTVIVLMGLSRLGPIVESLLSAQCSGSTPIAVISNGTLPDEYCRVGVLADITGESGNIVSPGVIVIGDVVLLRNDILSVEFAATRETRTGL